MTIALRLAELIQEKGLTKKAVAQGIGVAPTTLQTWVDRGEDFPARYIVPLAQVLGVSVHHLLTGDAGSAPPVPDDYLKLSSDELYLVNLLRGLDREGVVVVTNRAIEESRRAAGEKKEQSSA